MPTEPKSRKWFEAWREPGAFFDAAREDILTFFFDAPPQYLREAYIAGLFAKIWRDTQGPCEVRLLPEGDFPDAQLRVEGACMELEVTWALGKDEQPFKEARELREKFQKGEFTPAESLERRQAIAREAIPKAVRTKAEKHYATQRDTTLLVCSDDARALPCTEMSRLMEPWKNCFAAIYLLSGMDALRVWPTMEVLKGTEPP